MWRGETGRPFDGGGEDISSVYMKSFTFHLSRHSHTHTHNKVVGGCHTGDRKSLFFFLQRFASSFLAPIALPLTPASIHVCDCSSRGQRFVQYRLFVTQPQTTAQKLNRLKNKLPFWTRASWGETSSELQFELLTNL